MAPIADIDEMPGTEGYDAETGMKFQPILSDIIYLLTTLISIFNIVYFRLNILGIISPNKKCTQLQIDYQMNCEEKEPVTEKELTECDARKGKWFGDCVFGDHKIE